MTQESQSNIERTPLHWIPGILRNDLLRKMIALFFALLLYFMVTVRICIEEKVNNVPVNIDFPANLVNLDKIVPKVTVTVKGSKKQLSEVNASSLKIKTEVLEIHYTPGALYMLRLTPENVKTPFGVSVVDIDPKDIPLNLDVKSVKKVPVIAQFDSEKKLLKDYAVGKVKFNPGDVWVTGPESIIKDINSVPSAPIPLDKEVIDSFEYNVALAPSASTSISPAKAVAQVEIVKQYISRTLKSIPVRLLQSPDENSAFQAELLSTPNVDVTINGTQGEVALLKPSSIKPYIDISSLEEAGTFTTEVNCWVEGQTDMTVKNIYPQKVQVKLTKRKK